MTKTPTHDTERLLGLVLGIGTKGSSALLVAGLLLALAGAPAALAHGVLSAGLLVLIGTPIARVAVSVVEFVVIRDWWFVLCTGFVLMLLLSSLALAVFG